MEKTITANHSGFLEVYTFDGKLFELSALEPYLFNFILKEKTHGSLHAHAEIMLDMLAKKRIEQEVQVRISALTPTLMTKGQLTSARDALATENHRKAENAHLDFDFDGLFDDLEKDSNLLEKPNKASVHEETGRLLLKKGSFTYPDKHDAIDGIDEDRDFTQLYGKLGVEDTEIPGIELLGYFNSPESAPEEVRAMIDEYRGHGTDDLNGELSKILPEKYDKESRRKLYLISLILSEKGIAPRFRGYRRVFVKNVEEGENECRELVYSRDTQLFDLEWLRRCYPKHQPSKRMNGLYRAIADSDEFDFGHAYFIASSKFTAGEKAKQLRLSETMQMDNFAIRSKTVDSRIKALEVAADEVYTDLLEAAQRNRRRGAKLEKVIPDRIKVWLSAKLTHGNSISAMCDRYSKITGNQITPTSFRKKFVATNAALLAVDSKHCIS